MKESLRHIVGVQFRNSATVGGSIFGRFGFSDVLTMFLALDSYVELYKGGIVSMEEFAASRRDRDILVRVIVKKQPLKTAYFSQRNSKTDFPVLACAVSISPENACRAVLVHPSRAKKPSGIQGRNFRELPGTVIQRTGSSSRKVCSVCAEPGSYR